MFTWTTAELFGMAHIILPDTYRTVCLAWLNENYPPSETDNIERDITCPECLSFARALRIPTSG